MARFAKGDKITFSFEARAEIIGLGGIVLKVHINQEGHYVYDIKITSQIPQSLFPLLNISSSYTIQNIPASWIELSN
jgi:hypothetical protein